MTAAERSPPTTPILLDDARRERVVVGDGAMGTMLQAADLDARRLRGPGGLQRDPQRDPPRCGPRPSTDAYFEAGADAVETNTFGCNLSNLGDYDIADRIRELVAAGHRDRARGRRRADHPGPPALRARARWARAPSCRPWATPQYHLIRDAYSRGRAGHARRAAPTPSWSRPARTCCSSRPRCWARGGRWRSRAAHPGDRPCHRRDHRHDAAGQRDRCGADRASSRSAST